MCWGGGGVHRRGDVCWICVVSEAEPRRSQERTKGYLLVSRIFADVSELCWAERGCCGSRSGFLSSYRKRVENPSCLLFCFFYMLDVALVDGGDTHVEWWRRLWRW